MPTYEYVCRACGHEFEAFQKMSDVPITTCPACSTEAVERLISSGGGIVFKGSGFYATDYRDPPPKGESEAASGGSGSDGESSKATGSTGDGGSTGDTGSSGGSGRSTSGDSGGGKDATS